jgi:hypothetical protein
MAKSFENLADYGSATLSVLIEVARSVGTTLRAAIATTIFVDQSSDCGAGGIRRNECKTLLRLNGMRCFVASSRIQDTISRMGEREHFPENSWYLLLACCSTFT